jgi:hypothetical protein
MVATAQITGGLKRQVCLKKRSLYNSAVAYTVSVRIRTSGRIRQVPVKTVWIV